MSTPPPPRDAGSSDSGHDSVDELRAQVRQLAEALTGRAVIDQAKGVLMLHFGIDAATAFRVLVRWSSVSNVKVSALAEELTDAAATGSPAVTRLVLDIPRRGRLDLAPAP